MAGEIKELYLDDSATVKPVNSIKFVLQNYLEDEWYNPSSKYSKGQFVRNKIEEVRQSVADFINVNKDEIYFTSGAAESNNWAIQGFVKQCEKDGYSPIIITDYLEHSSLLKAVEAEKKNFAKVSMVGINQYGSIDKADLIDLLDAYTYNPKGKFKILVSIMTANNEIGTVQDIVELCEITHRYANAIFHTDATQFLHYDKFDNKICNVDLLSASAQKIGGLKGTGFFYIKSGIEIQPLIYGEQEHQYRGGTENTLGIIAMGEAIKQNRYFYSNSIKECRYYLIKKLIESFYCKINGDLAKRLPSNVNVTFGYNITGEALIYLLDMDGIYISAGSACNSNSNKPSHVLKAIGLTDEDASRTIRISLPDDITINKIDYFIDKLKNAIEVLVT